MTSLTIAQEFVLLVVVAVVGIAVLGAVAATQMAKVFEGANVANVKVMPSLFLLMQAADASATIRIFTWRQLADTNPDARANYEKVVADNTAKAQETLKQYESLLTDHHDLELLKADRKALADFLNLRAQAIGLQQDNKPDAAVEHMNGNQAIIARLIDAFNEHRRYNQCLSKRAADEAQAIQQSAHLTAVAVGGITMVVIALIGFGIAHSLLKQLGREPASTMEAVSCIRSANVEHIEIAR